jgi:hypothetical protein
MQRLSIKIWWLMVLVVFAAWACVVVPYWWNSHHQMLRRSQSYLHAAASCEQLAIHFRRCAKEALAGQHHIPGPTPGQRDKPESRKLAVADARYYEGIAADYDARARAYCRVATFPWLDPNIP